MSEKYTDEIWKDTIESPNYEVSNLGRIRCKDSKKICKQGTRYYGYKYILLDGNQHYSHRVVANAFIKKIKGKTQVNHINHVRDDNRSENLEWVTFSENIKKAWKADRFRNAIGGRHHNSHLTKDEVIDIKNKIKRGEMSQSDIANEHNVSCATITGIKNGRVWSHVEI